MAFDCEVKEMAWALMALFGLQFATIEPIASPPKVSDGTIAIDGKLNEQAWRLAQQLSPMCILGNGIAPTQPIVFICHDNSSLYIGAILPKPVGKPLRITVKDRDGEVWQDDAFEIFIDPHRTRSRYYQFIVNAGGAKWDSYGKDGKWDGIWHAASHCDVASDHWSVEFAIPFETIKARPKPEDLWGFNACWDRQTPTTALMTWAQLKSGFHEPENFGILVFPTAPPIIRNVSLKVNQISGELTVSANLTAREQPCELRMEFGSQNQLNVISSSVIQPGESKHWTAKTEIPDATCEKMATLLAIIRVSSSGKELYRGVIPVEIKPPISVTMRKYFLRTKRLDLEVDGSVLATQSKLENLKVEVIDSFGKVFATYTAKFGDDALARIQIDTSKAKPGSYKIRLSVIGVEGKLLHESEQEIAIPPNPIWLSNREGIIDKVLPPWTPLKVKGNSIFPWGREYRFGTLPFPEQVISNGRELLASPIRLIVKTNGHVEAWRGRMVKFTKRTPARVEFVTAAEGKDIVVHGNLWCEYDGCVRCDWQVEPKGKKCRLEEIIFEIPFKSEHARLIYHYPGRWGSAFNAGSVPKDGLKMGFRPYVWLGDEWRGLAWFCTSDEQFRPKDPKSVTEIARNGKTTTLRINIIQVPFELKEPIKFTFGFEATPIRPKTEDVWDYRIIHTGNYGLEERTWNPPMEIRWEAPGNINPFQGTIEAWVRPHFDPNPPVKPSDPQRGIYNRSFFVLITPDGTEVGYYWNIDDRGMRVYIRTPDGKYPIVFGAKNQWEMGEWHHIAMSWGDEIRLYCDGKLLARRPYKGLLQNELKGGEFRLGRGICEMDVDEFCISDVQREPKGHLGPLQPDEHTLLLEKFDELRYDGAIIRTSPAKGASSGIVSPAVRLVDGKFGRAVRLFLPPEERELTLDMYKRLGVRTICFHEHWSNIQNYFAPADPEGLRRLVKACHERGIKLLVYYGYELSNIAPEWGIYSDEVLVYPRAGGYRRKPEQTAYICCYASAWQDYLAWAIAKTIDEFDIDGVYLDGTANPWGCANLGHGCGYIGRDGKLHPTYTFFETREMMKRIYAIVKTRKPNGLVNVHQSTCMTIPSVGWATSYWDGEQFGHIQRTFETFPLDILPLDAFRAEFMGHNWGVPAELLCYGRPYTYSEALAISLLHDVLVRPGNSDLELASKIWKVAEDFGRKKAQWLPYWENERYVSISDENVKCSIYNRPNQGAMVIVSNLGKKPADVEIKLNLDALKLPQNLQAIDAVSGQIFPCEMGKLQLYLDSLNFSLLLLRPK